MAKQNILTRSKKKQALALFQANRLAEARRLFEEICAADRSDAEAWQLLGMVRGMLGDFAAAESDLRLALRLQPSAETHYYLGNALLAQNRLDEAVTAFQAALRLQPQLAEVHCNLGDALQNQGRYQEAETCYRKAIGLRPDLIGAHINLGLALFAQKKLDETVVCCQKLLRAHPELAEVHHNLGNAYTELFCFNEAITSYREAIRLKPNFAMAHNNLALALYRSGHYTAAITHHREALRLAPTLARLHNNFGMTLNALGRYAEAEHECREALRLDPQLAEAHNNIGISLHALGRYEEAIGHYRESLRLDPAHPETQTNLGVALYDQGEIDEAGESYRRALALAPNDGTKIKLATMQPPILRSRRHIDEVRSGLEKNLDALASSHLRLTEPDKEGGHVNFYLAYHGLNNRDLQIKIARLYEAACPELLWTAPHCLQKKTRGGPLKIGFISKFMYNHSIGKTTAGLLAELSRAQFRVYALFVPPLVDDKLSGFIRTKADEAHVLPLSLAAARRKIADLELDILFYQDIGMDPFTYFLAFSRLAPVQCVSFGHPDTTGITNMDYWVSNDLFEPDGAETHYSEKLFLLHDLGTLAYYYRPQLPVTLKPRTHFGLPEDTHVYLCPQTLFKFHPDFDAILAGILRADARARVTIIRARIPQWVEMLKDRFAQTFPDVLDRVMFVPQQNSDDFLSLLALADVILDTPHFNGMNTSLEAFAVGTPVVTWPGAQQRGRHTYGMYRKMGMNECVAKSADDYVAIAVRLGTDSAFRSEVKAKILARNTVLYEDKRVVSEFERFFREAAGERA